MPGIRRIAIALLVLSGVAAATTAVLWGAALAGLAHTSVIGSDAMRPAFADGDLVVSVPVATAELRPGDVISLPKAGETQLVTERVIGIARLPDARWSIVARADAASPEIAAEHIVGERAWSPAVRVPVVGGAARAVLEPAVGLPLLAAFGAVVAALLWLGPRARAERTP